MENTIMGQFDEIKKQVEKLNKLVNEPNPFRNFLFQKVIQEQEEHDCGLVGGPDGHCSVCQRSFEEMNNPLKWK